MVGYDQAGPRGWILKRRKVVFTKLQSSVVALTGGVPLSKESFEEELRIRLRRAHPHHPLGASSQ
ncbi:MAG: hypothetical protein IVW54_03950 [Candidatus Binataceae bacterium]|nr:hypothetical protein [Candidatus Binataceae bacterium]